MSAIRAPRDFAPGQSLTGPMTESAKRDTDQSYGQARQFKSSLNVTTARGQQNTLSIAGLDTRLTTAEGDIATLQTNAAADEANILTLQGQVATLQTNAMADEADILTLQGQVATLMANATTDEANIATLQGQVATLMAQMAALVLSGLGDVAVSSPTNGQVLTYQTSDHKWHNL